MFNLTEEQRMIVDAVSDIMSGFEDDAFTWEGEFPWKNVKTLADHGFFGLSFPTEYGGEGLSELEHMFVVETVGRVCPDTAAAISLSRVTARSIEMFGTDAAKEKYLPPVIAGDSLICIGISEPEAGSDVYNISTEATEEDGDIYLTGEKIWTSEFPEADAAVVWAQFSDGLGMVVVDLDSPGIEVNTHYTNMAGQTQTHWFMDGVRVPEENVLLRGENALKHQLKTITWERLSVASKTNAFALSAFDKALTYAKDREQFDQPISEFQGIQWKLADMAKQLQASRYLTFGAATTAKQRGENPTRIGANLANLYSSEMVESVVSEALQIHGAAGFQQGHPLEYLYRLARGRRIGGGTDEMAKNTIAKELLSEGFPLDY